MNRSLEVNGFDIDKIEKIIKVCENKQDDNISQDIYGVIYSLGRDRSNDEEYKYAYTILLKLCKHANSHVRACSILALSLMADSNILEKDVIIQIIKQEWEENKKYREIIHNAAEDIKYKLKWNFTLN